MKTQVKELITEIRIVKYKDNFPLTKGRRPVYYTKENKPPKRYKNPKYDKEGYLIVGGQRVLKNKKTVNKPRMATINGQAFYNGTYRHQRKIIAGKVHEYLTPFIKNIPKIILKEEEYAIIELEMHKPIGRWDLDNQWPWIKWFTDSLVKHEKLKDDSVQYIRETGKITYIPSNQKTLVFRVYRMTTV